MKFCRSQATDIQENSNKQHNMAPHSSSSVIQVSRGPLIPRGFREMPPTPLAELVHPLWTWCTLTLTFHIKLQIQCFPVLVKHIQMLTFYNWRYTQAQLRLMDMSLYFPNTWS